MKRRFSALVATGSAAAMLSTGTVPAADAQPLGHVNLNTRPGSSLSVPQMKDPGTGISTGKVPVQHPGAPVPVPFSPDYLTGYVSDVSSYEYGIYEEVVRCFHDIKTNQPGTRQYNLDKVIQVNNSATPDRIRAAQIDAVVSSNGLLEVMAEGLGPEFARHFRAALAEGRLPKTEFLLSNGYLARSGGIASSTFAEKEWFAYPRPFNVAPGAIKRYNPPGKDIYPKSKAFPSGHTNQATLITTLLAYLIPEAAPQLYLRGSEAGQSRMVLGVHYPLDVIGGRMTGQAAAADRLNDPKMRNALDQASAEIRAEMKWRTGKDIATLVRTTAPYASTADAQRTYRERLDYGFPKVYNRDARMIVPQAAPTLLASRYPNLNHEQRRQILEQTALPAGHPLDWQGPKGSWQRLDLVAASTAKYRVNPNGSVTVLR
ncbi:acid phosphatase [Corynebacterium aquatimens]|uniref:Membrane-associated phospholipid phosphatase n=1 Tax=Corynebacterium aquatimens TaxID=1190508 RepID=A0A931E0M8_9CORY|nr:phosphatase PAP2 family protein [Corynebacterium aquatimens]MBG6122108.1 membrane-associated phospholipid phosphatase [Corynebacterium aquatimens]WJY65351.1 Major phosphate-irrepressible acid phosphatase precursor [Corynebacterium aquatimens]